MKTITIQKLRWGYMVKVQLPNEPVPFCQFFSDRQEGFVWANGLEVKENKIN